MGGLYRFLRRWGARATGPCDFPQNTLPWLDKPINQAHETEGSLLPSALRQWQRQGFMVLPQAISHSQIDRFLSDFDAGLNNRSQLPQVQVRIDRSGYEENPTQTWETVPLNVLLGHKIKFNDLHQHLTSAKELVLHRAVTSPLGEIFGSNAFAIQSLTFFRGSQQPTHVDYAWIVSPIPSHLAIAWIALEDVDPKAGPLFYYPGSHRLKKFNFGNGIYLTHRSVKTPSHLAKYLDKECRKNGINRQLGILKKGDVILMHGGLAHGGTFVEDPLLTRKSLVTHFTSFEAIQHFDFTSSLRPPIIELNGGAFFQGSFYDLPRPSIV